jgi:putative DNA primase/helicase
MTTKSKNTKIDFLDGSKLHLKQIPKYPDFEGGFTENVDYELVKLLANDATIPDDIRETFKTTIYKNIKLNGDISVKHAQRHGLGRFYPENRQSLIINAKSIKQTLFKFGNWADIDMVKGHPTIAVEVFKGIIDLPNINYYINNFDDIVSTLSIFYKVDGGVLDKDNVKFLFNMMIYGGSPNTWINDISIGGGGYDPKKIVGFKEHHPLVLGFQRECHLMSDRVFINNPTLVNKLKKTEDEGRDTKNRVISYFFQIIENHIVYLAYGLLVNLNIITPRKCGLEYDGLNIPDNGTIYDKDEITNVLNNFVKSKTGMDIKFKFKGYDNVIKRHINTRENMTAVPVNNAIMAVVENDDIDDSDEIFDIMSQEFEKTHTKIINDAVFIKQLPDRNVLMSKKNLQIAYEHMTCGKNKNGTPVSFINKWASCNDKINKKDTMEIYPNASKCPENVFNLWIPFVMELYSEKYIEMTTELDIYLKHIMILCGNDKLVYDYFIGWVAMMIQQPEIKTTMIGLISKEGSGKGTLMYSLTRMLGKNKVFETKDPARDVWGNFNGIMIDAFLVNLNELEYKDTMEADGRIKALITDSAMTINQKGAPQINITSHHHFIMTTNKENPMKTSGDDRRKLIIRSSDELIKQVSDSQEIKDEKDAYFSNMYKMLNDDNVIKTCYEYFKNYDLTNYNYKQIPTTEHQNGMKELSMSSVERWLCDFVRSNYQYGKIEMFGQEAFNAFSAWCKLNNETFTTTNLKLGIMLKNLRIEGLDAGRHTNKGATKIYDIPKLKKHFKLENLEIVCDDTTP